MFLDGRTGQGIQRKCTRTGGREDGENEENFSAGRESCSFALHVFSDRETEIGTAIRRRRHNTSLPYRKILNLFKYRASTLMCKPEGLLHDDTYPSICGKCILKGSLQIIFMRIAGKRRLRRTLRDGSVIRLLIHVLIHIPAERLASCNKMIIHLTHVLPL